MMLGYGLFWIVAKCFTLLFGSRFDVWFFPKLSILEVGGRIDDFCKFLLFERSGLCRHSSFCN